MLLVWIVFAQVVCHAFPISASGYQVTEHHNWYRSSTIRWANESAEYADYAECPLLDDPCMDDSTYMANISIVAREKCFAFYMRHTRRKIAHSDDVWIEFAEDCRRRLDREERDRQENEDRRTNPLRHGDFPVQGHPLQLSAGRVEILPNP